MADQTPEGIKMIFTEEFYNILKKLEAENNYLAFELLWMIEPDSKFHNGLKISKVDVSKQDWSFDVTVDGKVIPMKIGKFVRYYFAGIISDKEASEFSRLYNKIRKGEPVQPGSPIQIKEFSYNPKDVRSTFLSLVTKTYPHGHEDEVLKFLPSLQKDEVGNYYKIIGKTPQTMFTSHLDTADREQKDTKLYSMIENGEEYIVTDESTILGADDKSGVAVMLYMMSHNIPGLYYFFIGEERGGIGSNKLSLIYDKVSYLKEIKRCVSFDRRNYHSVITSQLGRRCCSDEFGTALCKEYNKNGLDLSLDPTGIYTDSASFIDDIRECTNISVGYFHEHTGQEYQNMNYLISLCEASIKVNWDSLPTIRKVGINQEIIQKHKGLIADVKSTVFELEVKMIGDSGKVFIRVDLDDSDIESISDGLSSLKSLLMKYKMDPDIIFDGTYLKIELK
jgi:hypothetical protein